MLFVAIGLCATGLAILGVWVPGLPTTPLVLVALWAFSRSSARLSAWLRRIPLLRHAVEAADRYRSTRTLPVAVKLIAPITAWLAVPITAWLTETLWIAAIVAVIAMVCTVFMLRTPTQLADATAPQAPEPRKEAGPAT